MALTASSSQKAVIHPGLLIVIALTGVLGFTLGQNWKPDSPAITEAAIPSEDWHGNVRRSTWPD
ncbi:hypothetical protein [Ruegeria profundi]|uniref:Uncharacterized protein n=1 Tax=Ruegeria profundi TaxID=1685378 RepID=A0A0X3U2B3_9RHOB|nr:hypothetical protein [Ruegeria profundi]KUJ82148.1 hypothetical protein AVO44_02440 [Ruegeria profundi]